MSRFRLFLAWVICASAACGGHGLQTSRVDGGQDGQTSLPPDSRLGCDCPVVDLPPRDASADGSQEPGPPVCGNGVVESGEDCDDGNTKSSDGCSATCRNECWWYVSSGIFDVCGDGILDPHERCDDGNTVSGDGCSGDCSQVELGYQCGSPGKRCTPLCGDGIVTPPETCDDGNYRDGDGCTQFCLIQPGWECSGMQCAPRRPVVDGGATVGLPTGPGGYCGDGVLSGAEECDLGAQNGVAYPDHAGCTSYCSWMSFCGDGIVDSMQGEECDLGPKCNKGRDTFPCGGNCRLGYLH
jgi:cysteine-rich repeat protein